MRNIALFANLHMFREVEIIFWASLNTADDISSIVDKNATRSKSCVESSIVRDIIFRLMVTAFTTKEKLSSDRSTQAMTAFLSKHFGSFLTKH